MQSIVHIAFILLGFLTGSHRSQGYGKLARRSKHVLSKQVLSEGVDQALMLLSRVTLRLLFFVGCLILETGRTSPLLRV